MGEIWDPGTRGTRRSATRELRIAVRIYIGGVGG
jgi:hypothetical protein